MAYVQIFNPVINQRVKKQKLNVMGRVTSPKVTGLAVYLNNFMIRRVKPSRTGAFECYIDLSELDAGEHQIEIRAMLRHNTQRSLVKFIKVEGEEAKTSSEEE